MVRQNVVARLLPEASVLQAGTARPRPPQKRVGAEASRAAPRRTPRRHGAAEMLLPKLLPQAAALQAGTARLRPPVGSPPRHAAAGMVLPALLEGASARHAGAGRLRPPAVTNRPRLRRTPRRHAAAEMLLPDALAALRPNGLSYWDLHGFLLVPTLWLLTVGKPSVRPTPATHSILTALNAGESLLGGMIQFCYHVQGTSSNLHKPRVIRFCTCRNTVGHMFGPSFNETGG